MESDDKLIVDDSAKLSIAMHKILDRNNKPYYIGKLQFPGYISFDAGASFMVFVSEEDSEELQIGPLDPKRRKLKSQKESATMPDGKISIKLYPSKDSNNRTFYIGEAISPAMIPCTKRGIFFAAFIGEPGKEKLEISKLKHRQVEISSSLEDDFTLDETG